MQKRERHFVLILINEVKYHVKGTFTLGSKVRTKRDLGKAIINPRQLPSKTEPGIQINCKVAVTVAVAKSDQAKTEGALSIILLYKGIISPSLASDGGFYSKLPPRFIPRHT